MISLVGPALLRTSAGPGVLPDQLTALVSAAGLLVVIAGKITLGRSFGIAPANRGVVVAGPYALVRHPIYAGYLLSHVAFAFAYPTAWNIAVLVATDVALVLRALCEERVLAADRTYQLYCQPRRVASRAGGVFRCELINAESGSLRKRVQVASSTERALA